MFEINFRSYDAGRHWMIGPTSCLVDRALPACEEIYLPEAITRSGFLKFSITNEIVESRIKKPKIKHILESILTISGIKKKWIIKDKLVLDLRINSPANWAHAFTNHLPLAFLIKKNLDEIYNGNLLIILPENISKKIIELFTLSNFQVLSTNSPVLAKKIDYEMEPWRSIRCLRHLIIKDEFPSTKLYSDVINHKPINKKNIFISRKDSRKLTNENEVIEYLEKKGYEAIYIEEYSLIEQILLLCYAENIVAIHGAGLGPLLMRNAINCKKYRLIEIFSPAHVSDFYRVMTHQIGGEWIGVRGKAWPELMNHAYSSNIEKFSLSDFSVDLESIEMAIDKLDKK